MKKFTQSTLFLTFLLFFSTVSYSQQYTFEDFVGTWHGTIFSPSTGGATVPMTMTIESDGFYTETSGYLMPTLYPNTQQCEYESTTNRMHWWYLGTAWGGQQFYDHFFYEVVYFSNDTLEMHYNFWDDPVPHPDVGTIFLVKENLTPPPSMLQSTFIDNDILLSWDEPVFGNGTPANPDSYNIYYKMGSGDFELLQNVISSSYTQNDVTMAGMHSYFVTAVYNSEESNPSNQVEIELTTPAPTGLSGQLLADNVALFWDVPSSNGEPMASLMGYNIYHKLDEGDFELLMSVETTGYAHENINPGLHTYYVTAVYDGAESEPSNEAQFELIISAIFDGVAENINLYPNPATDQLNIRSGNELKNIQLYNQTGQVVMDRSLNGTGLKMDVSDLPAGLYILQLETERNVISKRLLVQ